MTKYYIENLGDQTLGDEIMCQAENDPRISEHPGMECHDRRGNRIIRNLYEVPKEVADRIVRMAPKAGWQYNRYRQEEGKLPREDISQIVPVRVNVFREARKNWKKISRTLPKGVMRGSDLLRKRRLPASSKL